MVVANILVYITLRNVDNSRKLNSKYDYNLVICFPQSLVYDWTSLVQKLLLTTKGC